MHMMEEKIWNKGKLVETIWEALRVKKEEREGALRKREEIAK